jgi:hypothetical protein
MGKRIKNDKNKKTEENVAKIPQEVCSLEC